MFAAHRGCLYLTHSFGDKLLNSGPQNFSSNKLETSLYRTVQKIYQCLQSFRRDSRVCQTDRRTDGRTDILIANVAAKKNLDHKKSKKTVRKSTKSIWRVAKQSVVERICQREVCSLKEKREIVMNSGRKCWFNIF